MLCQNTAGLKGGSHKSHRLHHTSWTKLFWSPLFCHLPAIEVRDSFHNLLSSVAGNSAWMNYGALHLDISLRCSAGIQTSLGMHGWLGWHGTTLDLIHCWSCIIPSRYNYIVFTALFKSHVMLIYVVLCIKVTRDNRFPLQLYEM